MCYKILYKINRTEQKCEKCNKKILIGEKIFIAGEVWKWFDEELKKWLSEFTTWGKCCSKECVDIVVYKEFEEQEIRERNIKRYKNYKGKGVEVI